MPEQNQGGAFFSADLAIAFVSLAFLFFLVSETRISGLNEKTAESESVSMQKTAFFLADSMVKNRDENNALLGMAAFNAGAGRVESNALPESLEGMRFAQLRGSIFVESVSIAYFDGNSVEIFRDARAGAKNCIATERLVLRGMKKALLRARVCGE
ncbi:MAG: hypothetical protein HY394_06060 [Candidatus Diapherotrites archaeon]|nr:hypothetical protein [Candidatus Diapherotrites archaeon]